MKAALERDTPEQPDVIFLFLCLPDVIRYNFVEQQICTLHNGVGRQVENVEKGEGGD